ncbi:hypothetical protein BJ742DRAFT_886906 [Cladochytrium replicatum]|nr:hypothetical protein BJ742DRAFT_886906 [Cladochytrium replicatum]
MVLVVRPALTRREVLFTNQLCYSTWGAPKLSPLEFEDLEMSLLSHPFAAKHYSCWILIDTEISPEDQPVKSADEILAACETFEREASIRLPGSPQIHAIRIHCVAAVHTPEIHRGKGYASTMIDLLRSKLVSPEFGPAKATRPWFEVPILAPINHPLVASILYSHIGPEFYARLGWIPHRAISTEIHVTTALGSCATWTSLARVKQLHRIDVSELDAIVQADRINLEMDFAKSAESHPDAVHFAVPLEADNYRFQLARSQWNYGKFASDDTRASVGALENRIGAWWGDGSGNKYDTFVLWKHEFAENKLVIRRFKYRGRNAATEPAQALLGAAILEAEQCGLEKVVYWDAGAIWESDEGMVDRRHFEAKKELPAGISVVTRTKIALPSLAYWGPRDAQKLEGCDLWKKYAPGIDVVWVNDEEHAWI